MDLTSAAVSAMRQVFSLAEEVAADTAGLLCLQWTRRNNWSTILLSLRFVSTYPNACPTDDSLLLLLIASGISIPHDFFLVYVQLGVTISPAFILSKLLHGLPILIFDRSCPILPLRVGISVPQQVPLPPLKDLLKLRICEGKLPDQRIAFLDAKNLHQSVYRMHTVLSAPTPTGA